MSNLKEQFFNTYKNKTPKSIAVETLLTLGPGMVLWLIYAGLSGRFINGLFFLGFIVAVNIGMLILTKKMDNTAQPEAPTATAEPVGDSLHQGTDKVE